MRLGELRRYPSHVNPTLVAYETDMEQIQFSFPKKAAVG
jgi:hypothetical protein